MSSTNIAGEQAVNSPTKVLTGTCCLTLIISITYLYEEEKAQHLVHDRD